MIPFNKHAVTGAEIQLVTEAISGENISGNGYFTRKCERWFEDKLKCHRALLTPSCTSALEMAAILIDIKAGDEVIMPSYTFVSTANAFVLRGAKIVFVDIRPDTMNIDESIIESAISEKTKAIVVVHYAGVSCEMNEIIKLAEEYNLYVIEDAAQGMMATYEGKSLGSIGHIGAYSFHSTKNYTSGGEGGLLIINDESLSARAEIIQEKGTNRSCFLRGQIDKYTWVDIGSSFLMSEVQSSYLYAQLLSADVINDRRLELKSKYIELLSGFVENKLLSIPQNPRECLDNGHMFYVIFYCAEVRDTILQKMRLNGIMCTSHYEPLHKSKFGLEHSKFNSKDIYTSDMSSRLMRFPLFYNMKDEDVKFIVETFEKVADEYLN